MDAISIKKLIPAIINKNRSMDPEGHKKLERFRGIKKNDYREKDNLLLRETRLVVLDIETTGLKPRAGDEVISIGACQIEGDKIMPEVFHRLVNPNRSIPRLITELTGITDDMVGGAEDFCTVAADLLDYIQDSVIIGHCVDFDIGFLNYKLKPYQINIDNLFIDTCMVSRALNANWKVHTLDSILANLGIEPEGRHTADGDALLTADVFLRFLDRLEDLRINNLWDLSCYIKSAIMYRI